eukprot:CAMPEP_0202439266 /NCGR_PEP_ID=MMETSP1345-20130828/36071_1 /ASSEMBLY_ACC=CAM_ASM_000843 /TAXON_ID=342563 /ORGANISM="Fabrea Fabrea salina" /LENGTH=155 /DNA_ID=CAMNT_0049053787 /DNA_START=973 /DNA_END=1436 /DNA_ORIENTATION=+
MTNIRTVYSFNRQNYFHDKYMDATIKENSNVMKTAFLNGFLLGFRYFVLYFIWGVICWYGAWQVTEDNMEIDDLLIVFFTMMFSTWGFIIVGELAPDVGTGLKSAKRMFEIIDYEPDINAKDTQEGVKDPIEGRITFQNVVFQYEGRSNIVLNNV